MASFLRVEIPPGLDRLAISNNLNVHPLSNFNWSPELKTGPLKEGETRVWARFAGVKHMQPKAWIIGRGFDHAVSEALRVAEDCVDTISISMSPDHRPIVEFRRVGKNDWTLLESYFQKLSRKVKYLFGFHSGG